jgi:hypothetical protein
MVLSASLDATLSLSGANSFRLLKGDLSGEAGVAGDLGTPRVPLVDEEDVLFIKVGGTACEEGAGVVGADSVGMDWRAAGLGRLFGPYIASAQERQRS